MFTWAEKCHPQSLSLIAVKFAPKDPCKYFSLSTSSEHLQRGRKIKVEDVRLSVMQKKTMDDVLKDYLSDIIKNDLWNEDQ